VLLHHLRDRDYEGKIAVSARSADDGDLLRLEGVDVLLRPYADAAEQAVDAITSAMDQLSAVADATPGLREVRLTPGSVWAGHRIDEVPLRDEFGVTVLAVSRAGRSFFNPGPDFQLFPGDRLILSGDPAALDRAMEYLGRIEPVHGEEEEFTVREVAVNAMPGWDGQTLVQLELPARYGITVVAATRGDRRLAAPDPQRPLSAGDRLVLAGTADAMAKLFKEVA
jgi:Trk K+ transport system NAD-binding subunit